MFITGDLIDAEKSFVDEGDYVTFKHAVLTKYNGAAETYSKDRTNKKKENEVIAYADFYIRVITENLDKLNIEQQHEAKHTCESMQTSKKYIRF
ncbi:hypothetical protein [Pseudoalteromonas sp. MEBiC 03485]|uniref:hypothetical protein n=1 Tax=Pseudoalteromonas sp. MEBiC 03485 TaxID=2571103 RepID=UPI00101FC979|nr:hypothetical protein [Pseudoalteromonas sp. MEBiC 03485]RZD19711.1 hypothetical protein EVU92_21145 [Pseudoalteromonas sp. MEBiC 03485]